jgi:flagellar protein FliO/FliZ
MPELGARGGGAAIKVLGAAAVGPRERVVLVEIGEDVLVLGVAPGSVARLHELKRADLPLPADLPAQPPAGRQGLRHLAAPGCATQGTPR